MNKKDSREVIRWQAEMWEREEQKAKAEQEKCDIGSCRRETLLHSELKHRAMKHAVLMCAESLKLITQEECDRCMEKGIGSVLKSPWESKAGGGEDARDIQQHDLPEVREGCT